MLGNFAELMTELHAIRAALESQTAREAPHRRWPA
jgi:hypothetical protein